MIREKVKKILDELLGIDTKLETPKDSKFGHFAITNSFELAKELRKSPMVIAEELKTKIEKESIFKEITVVSGFVNIRLADEFLDIYSNVILKDNEYGKKEYRNDAILIEYVSANPTGPLHIGHARGAILGDSLIRLGRYSGYDMKSEYWINDAGNQIKMLGTSVVLSAKEKLLGEEVELPKEYYRGEYIDDVAKVALEKFGKESMNYDEENIDKISYFAKNEILENVIKKTIDRVGIDMQEFVSEEQTLKDGWDEVKEELKANGGIYEKDGKLWLASSKFGDDNDRVILKDTGEFVYLTGDVIYHKNKLTKKNKDGLLYSETIDIWGADHHGHMPRIKAGAKFLGLDDNRLIFLFTQMVSLLKDGKPYKMSKRNGTFVTIDEIVDEIGVNALRFIFLTKKAESHLEFDLAELKNHDKENPIFYVNYAYSRVLSMIAKSTLDRKQIEDATLENLDELDSELLFESLTIPEVAQDAFATHSPQKVTEHTKKIASLIHRFYSEKRVLGEANEAMYLKLLLSASTAIKQSLNLLGITPDEKM